jgi:F-type H+-transporting ATPase subunit a
MASPILHIKDSYYFEVPKFMWRYHDMYEVPKFLRDAHPHASLADFQADLNGKIIIPQLPGTKLKNLYEVESGFGISKFMVLELVVALLMVVVFIRLAQRMKSGEAPKGRGWNLFEAILLFVRNDIARPAIDSHDDHGHDDHGHGEQVHGHAHGSAHRAHKPPAHDGDKFVPLLWTMFFFVLFSNLFGLVPWAGSTTGSFAVTISLAAVTFGTVLLSGMRRFGLIGFWLNQVPPMDLPWYMQILKLPIFIIEVFGMCIRHGILAVRLLANMVAGHLVLLGILGLAFSLEGALNPNWHLTAVISVVASAVFSLLELFVAFLQAYIFTFLSALFIGAAVHKH